MAQTFSEPPGGSLVKNFLQVKQVWWFTTGLRSRSPEPRNRSFSVDPEPAMLLKFSWTRSWCLI